jgi:hypothetical protein
MDCFAIGFADLDLHATSINCRLAGTSCHAVDMTQLK